MTVEAVQIEGVGADVERLAVDGHGVEGGLAGFVGVGGDVVDCDRLAVDVAGATDPLDLTVARVFSSGSGGRMSNSDDVCVLVAEARAVSALV